MLGSVSLLVSALAIFSSGLAAQTAAPSPSTAAAPAEPQCTAEAQLRSAGSNEPLQITIRNDGPVPLQIFWIKFDGGRALYKTLAPHEVYVQPTFRGHLWLASDAQGHCLTIFSAAANGQSFSLRPKPGVVMLPPDLVCDPVKNAHTNPDLAYQRAIAVARGWRDFKTFACWHYVSAAQGDARSQAMLAFMLHQGIGVAQDLPQAFAWAQKSAKAGNWAGEIFLGEMYKRGDGTPQNLKLAEYWAQKGDHDEPQEIRDAINAQNDANRFRPYADALVSAIANAWAENEREADEAQRNMEESAERERQAQENERRDREVEPPR